MFSFLKPSNVHDFSFIHRHATKTDGSSTLAVSEQQPRSRTPSPSRKASPQFAVGDAVLVIGTVDTPMVEAVITQVVAPASAGQSYRYRVREKGSDRIFNAAYPEAGSPIDESDLVDEGQLVAGSRASLRELVDSL